MATVVAFTFNPFQENTWLVIDEPSGKCAIVDPGCSNAEEEARLLSFIRENELQPALLLNTHTHIDHILGNAFIGKTFGLPLHIHPLEQEMLDAAPQVAAYYGLPAPEPYPADPDCYLGDGDELLLGETRMQVLFTPGHSPGEVSFLLPKTPDEKAGNFTPSGPAFNTGKQPLLLAGDVLFQRSIGRTDLPGGDFETLAQSIQQRLYTLPDDTIVLPGHGPATTIGEEKRLNPFVTGN